MRDRSILQKKLDPPSLDLQEDLDDEELFRRAMAEVKPISGRRKSIERHPRRPLRRVDPEAEDLALLEEFVRGEGDLVFEWSQTGEHLEGAPQGCSRVVMKKLRRGKYALQAELDLHGLDRSQARQELDRFIQECCRRELTCVRVIHGKGNNSPGNVSILKKYLPFWLSSRRLSRFIVAYTSARPVDGGIGAVYILLRKSSKIVRMKAREA